MTTRARDYSGIRTGSLVLLLPIGGQGQGKGTLWLAKCDCGKFKKVIGKDASRGRIKSCGDCIRGQKRTIETTDAKILRRLKASRRGATKRGYEWELSDELALELMTARCTYCGGAGGGIDRIDNKIGYIPSNTTPSCWCCNKMKGTLHGTTFIQQIRKVYANNPQI
jgi:hypothetical protein